MHLITKLVHPDLDQLSGNVLRRHAARGIVLRGESILLLFTERYNDFSFPGGGVDPDEAIEAGLVRELEEETGAANVQVGRHYGYLEEFRPHWKPEYDLMHMTSHFYVCEIDAELRQARMESHEVANGMRPLWVNVREAIDHNRGVMSRAEKTMGQSIQRETLMLEKVAGEFVEREKTIRVAV